MGLKPKFSNRKSKLLTIGYKAKNEAIAIKIYSIDFFALGFEMMVLFLNLLKNLKIKNIAKYKVEVVIKFATHDLEKLSIIVGFTIERINNIIALTNKTEVWQIKKLLMNAIELSLIVNLFLFIHLLYYIKEYLAITI